MVLQLHRVDAGLEVEGNHGAADRRDAGGLAVELQRPAVVIGDGQVDETGFLHPYRALDPRVGD